MDGSSTRSTRSGIVRDPMVRGGTPVVRGTRFPVSQLVAELIERRDGALAVESLADELGQDGEGFMEALRHVAEEYSSPWGGHATSEYRRKLASHLTNWKFASAKAYLGGQPDWVRDAVEALAGMLGDSGWLDGGIGTVVALCVNVLCDTIAEGEKR